MSSVKKAAAAMAFNGIISCLNDFPIVMKLKMVAVRHADGERPVMPATSHMNGMSNKCVLLLNLSRRSKKEKKRKMAPMCNPEMARMWIVPVS